MRRYDLTSQLWNIVGGVTGAAIVSIVTFGQAKVELRTRPARDPVLTPRRDGDGTWIIGEDVGIVIGIVFWVAVLAGVTAMLR